ncbi:ABC transporter permease [Rossellomorea marisflavi]|uniref:ABC transporter permease n=1 Tax=Rossellomorea marisflavi TaxID=189381 RepID=UPI0034589545
MMIPFIKKQLSLMIRNPQVLLILLGMPILLITILGFALGDIMNGETGAIEAKVGFVVEGDQAAELKEFQGEVDESSMSPQEKKAVKAAAGGLLPIDSLKKDLFGSKEVKKFIHLKEKDPKDLDELRGDDDYSAIIVFSKGYTLNMLRQAFLGGSQGSGINIIKNEGKPLTANMVSDMMSSYQEQYSLAIQAGKSGIDPESFLNEGSSFGSVEKMEDRQPLTSMTYFAVGMSVMFVLYIGTNMGRFAFLEKEDRVFDRIILAGVSPWKYLWSVLISTIILSFLQIGILFGACAIFYGVRFPDLGSFLIVTLCICFAVGGFGALITAFSYKGNTESISSFFSSIGVAVLAFLGGSFGPLASGKVMETLADLVPNGAAMTAYFKIFQGYGIQEVLPNLWVMLGFGLISIVVASIVFPKEGGQAV